MSDFTTTQLAGAQVLVEGKDNRGFWGQQVLDSTQWEGVKHRDDHVQALALVDDAIATLVAPIAAAVEAANALVKTPELDPLFYVVQQEGVDSVAGAPRILDKLNPDSVILRALEEGKGDRLIWVNERLTVTAQPVPVTDVQSSDPGPVVEYDITDPEPTPEA